MKAPKADLRPSEFMRARRPELFSDAQTRAETQLSREVFEYHLDTLTSRKQEIEFEHFCRRLSECEICPNLIPQTGPTGGGDSKVDAETYPVSDRTAERWYECAGREASPQIADIELLATLWQALSATVAHRKLSAKVARFAKRTKILKAELDRLA